MKENKDELLGRVNYLINQRSSYGRRYKETKTPGYELIWSNGDRRWFVQPHQIEKGRVLYLDANYIFVPSAAVRDLRALAEEEALDPLPLYRGSHEARGRGEFSLKGIEIPPPIKAGRNLGLPTDIQTERALDEKYLEN